MRSIATIGLGGTIPEKLRAIAAAGFDGVELLERDFASFNGSARDIRHICDDINLNVIAFQPLRDFEGCPREQLQERLDCAERMFDVMGELATQTILLCSNTTALASSDTGVITADLSSLAERARARGLRVGYEPLSWGSRIRSYREAWRLVEQVSDPGLGLVLDTFHTFCLNDDLSDLANIDPDRIFFVQVADAPRIPLDLLQWSRRFRCFPGSGDFDLPSFLAPLLAVGYGGPISLEIFSHTYPALPATAVAQHGFASLCTLENTAKRLVESQREISSAASAHSKPDERGVGRGIPVMTEV